MIRYKQKYTNIFAILYVIILPPFGDNKKSIIIIAFFNEK